MFFLELQGQRRDFPLVEIEALREHLANLRFGEAPGCRGGGVVGDFARPFEAEQGRHFAQARKALADCSRNDLGHCRNEHAHIAVELQPA